MHAVLGCVDGRDREKICNSKSCGSVSWKPKINKQNLQNNRQNPEECLDILFKEIVKKHYTDTFKSKGKVEIKIFH